MVLMSDNVIKFPIKTGYQKSSVPARKPYGGYFFIGISDDFEVIQQWEFSDNIIKEVLKDEILDISTRINTIFKEQQDD